MKQAALGTVPRIQRGTRWELHAGYAIDDFWSRVVIYDVDAFGMVGVLPWTYDIKTYKPGVGVVTVLWITEAALRSAYREVPA